MAATPKSAFVAHAAPKTPQLGRAVRFHERNILQHALATMFRKGMAVLPIPCRTPVVTCCTPRRKMPKLMIAMHGPASGVA